MRPAIRPDAELAAFAAAMGSKPEKMTERELQNVVLSECARLRLHVYHVPRGTRAGIHGTGKGWPDLVITGNHRFLFRECKSADGETSPEQDAWAWYLRDAGLDWAIWRPADLESGRIASELGKLAHG